MLIPKRVFSITKACDLNASRYALGAVKLERGLDGRPIAIATDGRRLVYTTWHEENGAEFPAVGACPDTVQTFEALVNARDFAAAGKFKLPTRNKMRILENVLLDEKNTNGRAPMVATDLARTYATSAEVNDGRFPKWREVIPAYDVVSYRPAVQASARTEFAAEVAPVCTKDSAVQIRLDARMLAELALMLAESTCSEENRGIDLIIPTNPDRAALLVGRSAEHGTETVAVLMPLALEHAANREAYKYPKPAAQATAAALAAAELQRQLDALAEQAAFGEQFDREQAEQLAADQLADELAEQLERELEANPDVLLAADVDQAAAEQLQREQAEQLEREQAEQLEREQAEQLQREHAGRIESAEYLAKQAAALRLLVEERGYTSAVALSPAPIESSWSIAERQRAAVRRYSGDRQAPVATAVF